MDKKEILKQLDLLEEKGFYFFPAWTMDKPKTSDRIKIPLGEIFDIQEMENELRKRPLFGDRRVLQISDGISFYNLIRELDAADRYEKYSESFDGDEDLERCRKKY